MKEHDLLDAIGEIDEKFIKQAGETKGDKNESIESIKENDNRGSNEKSSRGDNGSSKIGGNSKNTGIRSGNRNYFKWGLAAAAVMCALIAGGIIFKHSTNSNNNFLGGTASDKTDTLLYGGDDNTETATYDGEETAVELHLPRRPPRHVGVLPNQGIIFPPAVPVRSPTGFASGASVVRPH